MYLATFYDKQKYIFDQKKHDFLIVSQSTCVCQIALHFSRHWSLWKLQNTATKKDNKKCVCVLKMQISVNSLVFVYPRQLNKETSYP